ncbi:MAG: hypothetical protein Q7O12_01420 [Deltaproteobacteria bacterium]|nr:hypothetical protein [Deltaproteobacteria bacterium]
MTPEERTAQLEGYFRQVRDIIEAEDFWERVPERAREFSPENLEGLVKFAYFGGFIDMAGVRRLLMVDKPTARHLLVKWYEEVREQGCWLC